MYFYLIQIFIYRTLSKIYYKSQKIILYLIKLFSSSELNVRIVFGGRNILITLSRFWSLLSIHDKILYIFQLLFYLIFPIKISNNNIIEDYINDKSIYQTFIFEHLCYLKSLLKSKDIIINSKNVYIYTNDYIILHIKEFWNSHLSIEDRKLLNTYNHNSYNDFLFTLIILFGFILLSACITIYLIIKNIYYYCKNKK